VVHLNIKLLKYFTKELNGGKAKATDKEVLENNNIVLIGLRYRLALWKFNLALGDALILLKLKDHPLGHQRRPKVLGLSGHGLHFLSSNQIPNRSFNPSKILLKLLSLRTSNHALLKTCRPPTRSNAEKMAIRAEESSPAGRRTSKRSHFQDQAIAIGSDGERQLSEGRAKKKEPRK